MPEVGSVKIYAKVLESNDPKLLLVADASDWFVIKNKPSVIEITLPGAATPISYAFVKGSINIYNSKTLQLGCDECDDEYGDLPDGVYKLKISGSPDTFFYEFYYLKTDVTRLELDKKRIAIGFQYSEEARTKNDALKKIEFYLDTAQAQVRLGYIAEGNKYFQEAQNLLRKCNNC